MKFNLLLALCFISSAVLSQQEGCEAPKGINGELISKYPNGNIRAIEHYKNGILDGNRKEFYENGNLKREEEYSLGKLLKLLKQFYENGQIYLENINNVQNCYYENGKLKTRKEFNKYATWNGKSEGWWPNGNKQTEENYYNGKKHGAFINWYENGKIRSKGNYSLDLYDGIYYCWYDNGQLQYKMDFLRGKIFTDSTYTSYYANGKILETGNYEKGTKKGNWKFYNEDGTYKEGILSDGNTGMIWRFYDENGKLTAIENHKNHYSHIKTSFDGSGKPLKEEYYTHQLPYLTLIFIDGDTSKGKWEYIPCQRHSKNEERDSANKFMNSASGYFENGNVYYNEIMDVYGNPILEKGNGEYFYLFENVSFAQLPGKDNFNTLIIQENYFTKSWSPILYNFFSSSVDPEHYMTDESLFFSKGKFTNGMKQGLWKEGFFIQTSDNNQLQQGYIQYDNILEKLKEDPDNPYRFYATGNYVNGKREGIWQLRMFDMLFEGGFINGKKEGEWELKSDISNPLNEKEEDPYSTEYGLITKGNYKNDFPDGIWTYKNSETNHLLFEEFYSKGKSYGRINTNYKNGKPNMRSIIKGDTVFKRIYISPLGDTLKCEPKTGCYLDQFPAEYGKRVNGKFYTWYPNGNIKMMGAYLDGKNTGSWYELTEKGDTVWACSYVNGLYNGRYMRKNDLGAESGHYLMDRKIGYWIEYDYYGNGQEYRKETTYTNGQIFVHSMWDKQGRQLVMNGNGARKRNSSFYSSSSPNDAYSFETIFKNGRIRIEREFYKNGLLKREFYKTNNGDSLTCFNSLNGSKCIYQGNGYISYYDKYNVLEKNEIYSGGRIVKKEDYYNGKHANTCNYFYAGIDTIATVIRKVKNTMPNKYEVQLDIKFNCMDSVSLKNKQMAVEILENIGKASYRKLKFSCHYKNRETEKGVHIDHINDLSKTDQINYTIELIGDSSYFNPVYSGEIRWKNSKKETMVYIFE